MTYTPMHIAHINDVLPHVEGRRDFVVARKDGYTVIDYVFAGPDTFDHPARIECRGLKFGKDGRILARPFQKFFNVGEKPETFPDALDFGQPHSIMDKLDGSMIHPALVGGRPVFMTRMGRTDVAIKAERHMTPDVISCCAHLLLSGFTPIFEFVAPDNRIVVPYAFSEIALLAIRATEEGEYADYSFCARWASRMKVSLVPHHAPDWTSGRTFLEHARAIKGKEGFVVRFASGLMVKAKGEDYVLKHRAKDSVLQEKNVLQLVLRGEIDDVLPLLDPADREVVEGYRDEVLAGIGITAWQILSLTKSTQDLSQKEFAVSHAAKLPDTWRAPAFKVRAGVDPHAAVIEAAMKGATSSAGVAYVRSLFGANYSLAPGNDNVRSEEVAA